jgi:hypothetical protein
VNTNLAFSLFALICVRHMYHIILLFSSEELLFQDLDKDRYFCVTIDSESG